MPNTNSYRWPEGRDPLWAADAIEERIQFEGPETVSAVILEPVQNAGGCFPPQDGYFQRVREICDKYGVVMISDEVICSWGRLGTYFGAERYGYQPDIITTAKALTSAYAPMGAMIVSDKMADAVHGGHEHVHPRVHLRRPPDGRGGRDGQPGHLRARGPVRPRAREGGRVPGHARVAARHPDRGRRARRRLLPGHRAGEGQGDQGELRRRGVRGAAARLPVRRAVRARPDLPRRRPRRPGDPALAAARGGHARSSRRSGAILRTVLTEASEKMVAR